MQDVFTKIAKWSAALMGGIALTACSKVVSFVEEVEIDGKTYQVERREYFDQQPIQLEWRYRWLESEIYVKDLSLPRWRANLWPMYIGKAKDGSLVLVTLIRSTEAWVERGSPRNWYVAFRADQKKWIEVPVPLEFEGRKASFMMGIHVEAGEKELITKADREFRNKISAPGRAGRVELNLSTQR